MSFHPWRSTPSGQAEK
jgi:catechol 2,3-dioxygenase-like lactoylglutathione lyase family enzyme